MEVVMPGESRVSLAAGSAQKTGRQCKVSTDLCRMAVYSYFLQEEVTQGVSEKIVDVQMENAVHMAEADSTTKKKERRMRRRRKTRNSEEKVVLRVNQFHIERQVQAPK